MRQSRGGHGFDVIRQDKIPLVHHSIGAGQLVQGERTARRNPHLHLWMLAVAVVRLTM